MSCGACQRYKHDAKQIYELNERFVSEPPTCTVTVLGTYMIWTHLLLEADLRLHDQMTT